MSTAVRTMATVGSTAAQETTGTLVTAITCGKPCCRKDVNNSGDASRAGAQATTETAANRVNIGSRCNRAIMDKLATAWVSATEGLTATADMTGRWRTNACSRDASNSRVLGS